MSTAEKYVAAAYLVFLAVVLIYIVIYAFKLQRLEREITELNEQARKRNVANPALADREEADAGEASWPSTQQALPNK